MDTNTITLSYYPADGCSLDPRSGPDPLERTYPSRDEAVVALAAAGVLYGSWVDQHGQECFHESDEEGCGGYVLIQAGAA